MLANASLVAPEVALGRLAQPREDVLVEDLGLYVVALRKPLLVEITRNWPLSQV